MLGVVPCSGWVWRPLVLKLVCNYALPLSLLGQILCFLPDMCKTRYNISVSKDTTACTWGAFSCGFRCQIGRRCSSMLGQSYQERVTALIAGYTQLHGASYRRNLHKGKQLQIKIEHPPRSPS